MRKIALEIFAGVNNAVILPGKGQCNNDKVKILLIRINAAVLRETVQKCS